MHLSKLKGKLLLLMTFAVKRGNKSIMRVSYGNTKSGNVEQT